MAARSGSPLHGRKSAGGASPGGVSCGGTPALAVAGTIVRKGKTLLPPFSLTLRSSEWVCLLGRSGAGKTSLLRAIAGLLPPDVWSGETIAGSHTPLRFGWMAQADDLAPWASLLDNVTLPARLRGEAPDCARALDALDSVGLAARIRDLPGALSTGQRQRVALARMLAEGSAIILLDEPFSALDALTGAKMRLLAARLLKGRSVLHVTHDPAEAAMLAHRCIIVQTNGRMREMLLPGAPPREPAQAESARIQRTILAHLEVDPPCNTAQEISAA